MKLVLASTSKWRKNLLDRLCLDYVVASPDIDETALAGETAGELVVRLARCKAEAVTDQYPQALIIGSDQCAVIDDSIVGKPGNFDNGLQQLRMASGKKVVFHTGLCLLNSRSGKSQSTDSLFSVYFRNLDDDEIKNYLTKEQPYDCAGSFRSEGLGITLFEKFEGDDPNALVGLPLIELTGMLKNEGINPLA